MFYYTLEGHLKNYARKTKAELPENYQKILTDYYRPLQQNTDDALYGKTIYFSPYVFPFDVSDNLNAFSHGQKKIEFDEYWAERIIFHQDPELFNAFCLTAGHEMTHKSGEFNLNIISYRKRKLKNWVREVRADFGGTVLMLGGDRTKAVKAMEYKKSLNRCKWLMRQLNKMQHSHPPMDLRIKYLREYDFDERLIEEIAKDAKCNNQKFIKTISNFYFKDQTAILKGKIIKN